MLLMWGGVTPHWVKTKLSTIVHFDFFLNVGKLPRNNTSYVMTSAHNSIKKSIFMQDYVTCVHVCSCACEHHLAMGMGVSI